MTHLYVAYETDEENKTGTVTVPSGTICLLLKPISAETEEGNPRVLFEGVVPLVDKLPIEDRADLLILVNGIIGMIQKYHPYILQEGAARMGLRTMVNVPEEGNA